MNYKLISILCIIKQVFLISFAFNKKNINKPTQNRIIVELAIGTPPQNIPFALEFFSTGIWVISEGCGDFISDSNKPPLFISRLSSTYKKQTEEISNKEYVFNTITHYIKAARGIDTFLINNTSITNFSFFLARRFTNLVGASGVLGLDSNNVMFSNLAFKGFITQLFEKEVINQEMFYIKYKDDNNGDLIIGDSFRFTEKTSFIKKEMDNHQWRIKLDDIDYGADNIIIPGVTISFKIELNGIIGAESYYNFVKRKFFEKQIEKGKCVEFKVAGTDYYTFKCKKGVPISLPKLSFELSSNYSVVFTNEDMYTYDKEENMNILIFLFTKSSFSSSKQNEWVMGEQFFKKQIIIFDSHDKSITFTPNQLHPSFSYLLIFIILAVFLFLIIIGLFVYRYMRVTQVRKTKKKSKEKGLIPIDNWNTFCTESECQNELKEMSW